MITHRMVCWYHGPGSNSSHNICDSLSRHALLMGMFQVGARLLIQLTVLLSITATAQVTVLLWLAALSKCSAPRLCDSQANLLANHIHFTSYKVT